LQQADKPSKIVNLPPVITKEEKSWADIMEEEEEEKIPVKMPVQEELINEEKSRENDGKIIIEVPEHMAMDILNMMLISGKTNFELKIKK
jgi:hypothetical protein